MISTNIDVSDGLFNGACGVLKFVELQNRKINAIYIEFDDDKTGAKARTARFNVMQANAQIQTTWTPITVFKRSFFTGEKGKVQVNREQFPVLMAEAITIHKSQGRTEQKVCVDVRKGMNRQKYYVAFSRATSLNGLYILGKFNPPTEIEQNDPVKIEMERLREDPLIPKFQFLRMVPENVIQIISHNVQSIRKHITTVVADSVYTSSHILAFQESWAVNNESYNIPEFEEISRNNLPGRPRAFGTINYCRASMEPRITERIEIEQGDAKNHVELSGYRIDNRLTIINVYNNPASNLDLLKETIMEIEEFIGATEDVLIMGDFNHQLIANNHLEKFLKETSIWIYFHLANRQRTPEQLLMAFSED